MLDVGNPVFVLSLYISEVLLKLRLVIKALLLYLVDLDFIILSLIITFVLTLVKIKVSFAKLILWLFKFRGKVSVLVLEVLHLLKQGSLLLACITLKIL